MRVAGIRTCVGGGWSLSFVPSAAKSSLPPLGSGSVPFLLVSFPPSSSLECIVVVPDSLPSSSRCLRQMQQMLQRAGRYDRDRRCRLERRRSAACNPRALSVESRN